MTEISREGYIRLKVMSTDVEGRQKKAKYKMSNWPEIKKKISKTEKNK